jgi:hypothetical protein
MIDSAKKMGVLRSTSTRTRSINAQKVLFIYSTFGWLAFNFMAAVLPNSSFLFIALRDSWVFLFLGYLLIIGSRSAFIVLVGIGLILFIGAAPLVGEQTILQDYLILFYGFRDICLIAMVYFLLARQVSSVNEKLIYIFVYIVAFFFIIEVVSQIAGFHDIYSSFFNLYGYFDAKGVSINLGGGFFGSRASLPLYSPGLIAVLLGSFIIVSRKLTGRWVLFLISLATVSKVAVFYLILRIFKKVYVGVFIVGMVLIPIILANLDNIISMYPNSHISANANSIAEHITPHSYITSKDFSLLPDALGSSSIVASVMKGVDSSYAPESLLIARFMDYNLLSVILIYLLVLMVFHLKGEARFFFIIVLALLVLTGMANHPVAILPALFFILCKGNGNERLATVTVERRKHI